VGFGAEALAGRPGLGWRGGMSDPVKEPGVRMVFEYIANPETNGRKKEPADFP
jgi:hypothetical protein